MFKKVLVGSVLTVAVMIICKVKRGYNPYSSNQKDSQSRLV